ncbi:MAG TPA: hypothetical protein VF329_09635 [Gammaproteobacteria bacterium]
MHSRRTARTAAFLACLAAVAFPAAAQEGFPLDGTWRGEWGPPGEGHRVVIVMDWDGERINGMINPGPESIEFRRAELEPSTWTVRIEAVNHEDQEILIEGTLQDIGSYNRYIVGTWTQDGAENPFKITRE